MAKRGGDTIYGQDPHSQVGDSQMRGEPPFQSFSPRSNGYRPHHRLPRTSGFEDQKDLYMREPEGCEKLTPLSKGAHKISHAFREDAVILN